MLNRIGPSTEPWEMPLVPGLALDLVPLSNTLWARPFSLFQSHSLSAPPAHFCWSDLNSTLKKKKMQDGQRQADCFQSPKS